MKGHDIVRLYFGSGEDPQPDGWLDTGDLGFLIDGEVYITGRVKDVIIRGGANVHAHLVEESRHARDARRGSTRGGFRGAPS